MGKIRWCATALAVFVVCSGSAMGEESRVPSAAIAEIFRSGVGEWCYNQVGEITDTLKADYLDFAVAQAKLAQAKYGIPGAVMAAMAIHESGYGRTRLAILANNVLAFKYPSNVHWRFDRPKFDLWCQPDWDTPREYIHFGSKEAAFDYVAKVFASRPDLPYAAITKKYQDAVASGTEPKSAAKLWLREIVKKYTEGKDYVPLVEGYIENPLGMDSPHAEDTLWARIPFVPHRASR
ncbi:glucosaminidase domain-containing protein [Rhizobium leguminosarum]|uniref:glucosaminidase domain-containing protein n=1 Tax=Rhizobium leguminosarum TaxID=384 RepID=UPI001037C4DD|nr:glucosaminidase domain-containing protein [Rhizobium leguminosarum]TBF85690.1 hypothetical protein ELG85_37155 [Rhizobium leguminosarum]